MVLDFEATCLDHGHMQHQEIIEFPVLLLEARSLREIDCFHRYIRPVVHPQLSDFCIRLTGIIQDMVDFQPTFSTTMKDFENWVNSHFPTDREKLNFAFVTCGDWDLRFMLPHQASISNYPVPPYCRRWINVKRAYAEYTGQHVDGIVSMLRGVGLPFEGRLHSGIDDCHNIAKILRFLVERNANLRYSQIPVANPICAIVFLPSLSLSLSTGRYPRIRTDNNATQGQIIRYSGAFKCHHTYALVPMFQYFDLEADGTITGIAIRLSRRDCTYDSGIRAGSPFYRGRDNNGRQLSPRLVVLRAFRIYGSA
ncbi:ERI1 exoribonuclease 3 [Taenia crassiceps]|uniref:ERI1 exoribonuclease 3 n=1 Tax=Taenia crassiceps TaxID=6207 RepID=A0ABR4Q703_9CEST